MDHEAAKETLSPALRVEGKSYVISELIEKVDEMSSAPTNLNKLCAIALFVIFYCSIGIMEQSKAGWGALLCALIIYELGRIVGMLLVGWRKVGLVFVFLVIPLAVGDGISAGRKAVVSLAAPAVGLIVGILALAISSSTGAGLFFQQLAYSLLFLSSINLIPIKPFDGGSFIEHLVLIKFPKLELGYLILSGIVLFLFIYSHYIAADRYVLGMVALAICSAQFMGAKKADNMACMISMIRTKGQDDLKWGRYSVSTVKRMMFFLDMFDLPNETSITLLLKEVWDRAREIPATLRDVSVLIVAYLFLVAACFQNQMVQEMFSQLK